MLTDFEMYVLLDYMIPLFPIMETSILKVALLFPAFLK